MTTAPIGAWVARFVPHAPEPFTKWHLVESVIAGREVTRCGRQLAKRDDSVLGYIEEPASSERCLYCDRGR